MTIRYQWTCPKCDSSTAIVSFHDKARAPRHLTCTICGATAHRQEVPA